MALSLIFTSNKLSYYLYWKHLMLWWFTLACLVEESGSTPNRSIELLFPTATVLRVNQPRSQEGPLPLIFPGLKVRGKILGTKLQVAFD